MIKFEYEYSHKIQYLYTQLYQFKNSNNIVRDKLCIKKTFNRTKNNLCNYSQEVPAEEVVYQNQPVFDQYHLKIFAKKQESI